LATTLSGHAVYLAIEGLHPRTKGDHEAGHPADRVLSDIAIRRLGGLSGMEDRGGGYRDSFASVMPSMDSRKCLSHRATEITQMAGTPGDI
jgi:hypothetical protein